MPSVLDFYSDSLAEAGLIQPGQTPSGNQVSFTRRKFADLVRSWSEIRERLFYVPEVAYTLAAAKGAYKIGPGAADFDTIPGVFVRPVFIQSAQVVIGTARRFPLSILTRPQWEVYQPKSLTDPDGPLVLFYDFAHPISTINLGPIPGGAQTMYLSQWNPLRVFQDGEEALNVEDYYPEAYLLPLRCGLAISLASSHRRPVSQETLGVFQNGIQIIEAKNREKLSGAFGFTQTLETGATKGDGIIPPGLTPQQIAQGTTGQ